MTINEFSIKQVGWVGGGLQSGIRGLKRIKKWNICGRQKFILAAFKAMVSLSHTHSTAWGTPQWRPFYSSEARLTETVSLTHSRRDRDASLVLTPREGGQWKLIRCGSTWVNWKPSDTPLNASSWLKGGKAYSMKAALCQGGATFHYPQAHMGHYSSRDPERMSSCLNGSKTSGL